MYKHEQRILKQRRSLANLFIYLFIDELIDLVIFINYKIMYNANKMFQNK